MLLNKKNKPNQTNLTGTTCRDQSGHWRNTYGEVFFVPKSTTTGSSLSDTHSSTMIQSAYSTEVAKPYLPNPSARAGYDARSICKRSLTGFEFRVFLLLDQLLRQGWRASLSYYLPIAAGRMIGFIPFPSVLVLCEMQSAWSRIWSRVAVSISYDDNHYTTGTS